MPESPFTTMRPCLLPAVLLVALACRSAGAIVMSDPSRLVWEFTLTRTGKGSTAMDQFVVQFGADRLDYGERLFLSIRTQGQPTPTYTKTMTGISTGTNGLLSFGDLDVWFPAAEGSVTIEMLEGTVDVHQMTIIWNSPTDSATTSIMPDIRLIPEPDLPALLAAPVFRALLQRRRRGRLPDANQSIAAASKPEQVSTLLANEGSDAKAVT